MVLSSQKAIISPKKLYCSGFKLLKIALNSVSTLNSSTVIKCPASVPFYRLPNSELSTMKIYLLFATVTKSIPQIHIAAILLMTKMTDYVTSKIVNRSSRKYFFKK